MTSKRDPLLDWMSQNPLVYLRNERRNLIMNLIISHGGIPYAGKRPDCNSGEQRFHFRLGEKRYLLCRRPLHLKPLGFTLDRRKVEYVRLRKTSFEDCILYLYERTN